MPSIDFKLYLITDRRLCAAGQLTETVRQALDGGVRCVQLREKDLPGAELYRLAVELRTLTRRYNAKLLVNDRLDIAMASGADGVHLGIGSLPVAEARRLTGASMIIGYSAHGDEETLQAHADGADFVTCGPVYHTPSKAAYGEPYGVKKLTGVVRASKVPVFALGGIAHERVVEVMRTGVQGIAVISAILAAADPRCATENMLKQMETHVRRT